MKPCVPVLRSVARLSAGLCFWAAMGLSRVVPAAEPTDVDPIVLAAEAQRIAVMNRAKDTVLAVFGATAQGGGSGVVITPDGYALTNFHVAKPCGSAMKCGMADGKVYDAVIVGIDPTGDVALIKLLGRNDFPAAELGDSDQLRVGDNCFAMGHPFMLATDFQPTVTYGIVSGVNRYQPPAGTLLEYTDCIQTDASINPGNSGGPLFDAEGRLVGINGRGSFEKRGRVNVGVAYAISINQIKNFLGHLHSGRIVDHATLGAVVAFDDQGRVIISDVLEESDAYRRGLRYGDELISFAGRPIPTPNAFKNVLGTLPKGWRVPLSFRRDGKRYDVFVRLQGVHGKEELIEKSMGGPRAAPGMPPQPKDGEKKPARKPEQPSPETYTASLTQRGLAESGRDTMANPFALPGLAGERPPKDQPPKPENPPPKSEPPKIIPIDPRGMTRQAPMPEAVKKVFEEKHGFSNYYFNKLHRGRVWQGWIASFPVGEAAGTWKLSGRVEGGNEFVFTLTDADAALKLPTLESQWIAGEKLTASLNPPHSGGLLLALHLWRRLNLVGPEKYGDVYYLGTSPLPKRQGLFDVLVATYREVETHFYFDPQSGLLTAVEMYADEHDDPCELYFDDYETVGNRKIPRLLTVVYGNDKFAAFRISEATFDTTSTSK